MSKYTKEFKLKVVKYCLEEHRSHRDAAKCFGANHEEIRQWIKISRTRSDRINKK